MKLIDFIRLVRKHLVLLMLAPLLMSILIVVLTRNPRFTYSSQTVLYTGLATGSSIEMDKSFNYFVTNTAFDNLLNIINSRETQQEVAIRLLSQHLLLSSADPKYISKESFKELNKITPPYIKALIARNAPNSQVPRTQKENSIGGSGKDSTDNLSPVIDSDKYELTVRTLTELMKSSDTNFVYRLLNFEHPHYSLKAIAEVKALRVANSDLIKLTYEVDDPGICQQTLAILNEVCIKNYRNIKENRSDEVVKYFENQLQLANVELKNSEEKLLAFNKQNNIINYYEQSKAVAVVKEDMEVDYNNKKAQLAGHEAAIKRLEAKLDIQQLVQLKSAQVLDKKKKLGDLNYEIASREAELETNPKSKEELPGLKSQAEKLKNEIKESIDILYTFQNTTDGLPVNNVLNEWLNNIVEAENLRAKLMVMDQRNREFQQQYSIYAPAGANIKKIEREISVAEQGYLEILHGLNLAKLKLQDNELSSNLKTIDPPYYPISPLPTKRKILVVGSAFFALILVIGTLLALEYFDNTLKNLSRSSKATLLTPFGIFPKCYQASHITEFPRIQEQLLSIMAQHIEHAFDENPMATPKIIIIVSTQNKEGKTTIASNLAKKLQSQNNEVVFIDLSKNFEATPKKGKRNILGTLLGYQDQRINIEDPFLAAPTRELEHTNYIKATIPVGHKLDSLEDLNKVLTFPIKKEANVILIELPALIEHQYSSQLLAKSDLLLLVCRANRVWTEADSLALENATKNYKGQSGFVLNGTEIDALETVLGELPKKRSIIRKFVKRIISMQFFSKNSL